ncbi:hypothetical protein GE061_001239 [Apolygus lucorum]|uniref:Uncharacterized protein n=1 Tax=Apolygus lucorum TaxID=248454 RepID=A0A8S9Y850_APOLU|nr:hypothetical protein GE061_001239 [Apolygus lucorum]
MSLEQCLEIKDTKRYLYAGQVIATDIELGVQRTYSKYLAGNVDTEGSCSGEYFTYGDLAYDKAVVLGTFNIQISKHRGHVDLTTSEIHIPKLSSLCDYKKYRCLTPDHGLLIWDHKLEETECEQKAYEVLYTGFANFTERKGGVRIVSLSTEDLIFSLMIHNEKRICNHLGYTTEHPRLFILEAGHDYAPFKLRSNSSLNANLISYINTKIVFIERHLTSNLESLYDDVTQQKCELERNVIMNQLTLAYISEDEFAYNLKQEPGYSASSTRTGSSEYGLLRDFSPELSAAKHQEAVIAALKRYNDVPELSRGFETRFGEKDRREATAALAGIGTSPHMKNGVYNKLVPVNHPNIDTPPTHEYNDAARHEMKEQRRRKYDTLDEVCCDASVGDWADRCIVTSQVALKNTSQDNDDLFVRSSLLQFMDIEPEVSGETVVRDPSIQQVKQRKPANNLSERGDTIANAISGSTCRIFRFFAKTKGGKIWKHKVASDLIEIWKKTPLAPTKDMAPLKVEQATAIVKLYANVYSEEMEKRERGKDGVPEPEAEGQRAVGIHSERAVTFATTMVSTSRQTRCGHRECVSSACMPSQRAFRLNSWTAWPQQLNSMVDPWKPKLVHITDRCTQQMVTPKDMTKSVL